VRIAVKAAGINFADLVARVGLYPDAPKTPFVPGYEVAGKVDKLGPDVTGIRKGERVVAGTRFGGYAELVIAKAKDIVKIPKDWSFEQAAALPVNYATAYAAIDRYGALRQNERVLIQAAAGGVGIAATQLAKHVGAEIFGTASKGKHKAIKEFGVDHAIDYRSQDFAKAVRKITGEKECLDLILDAIGGSSFRKGYATLRPGGRLVCFGASSVMSGEKRSITTAAKSLATTPIFHPLKMSGESKSVLGLNVLRLWDSKGSLEEFIDPLKKLMRNGVIQPVVAKAFPLEKGPDAHRFLQEGKNIGKVVLTVE
jgi:NADPH:quinone reductase-like Zn-dependent oxidoreductase